MRPTRRVLLSAAALILAAAQMPARAADPRMADRAEGKPDAPVTVTEWFSFTCPHCAHFSEDVFPEIKAKLIDTGKLRFVFKEYPRDQTDLMAAMVARSLPDARYEPFKDTLFATQTRWAFDRSKEPKEELAKMAALAGMPRETFDQVTSDEALKAAILADQDAAEKRYAIDSTPTFIVNGKAHTGEAGVSYASFAKMAGF